jgi:hypothetical protein
LNQLNASEEKFRLFKLLLKLARVGEVAVDTADTCFPKLRNLLEQSIHDLGGSIISVDENSKTRGTYFRRHDGLLHMRRNVARVSGAD